MKKIFSLIFLLLVIANSAFAYQIQPAGEISVPGDFLLGPGKKEFSVARGQTVIDTIEVINNSGARVSFSVSAEDISGTNDLSQSFKMLGPGSGPYSIKDYIFPETPSFSLDNGQKIILPIEIKIPYDISTGGLYGAVIVQTKETQDQPENNSNINSGTKIIGRLAQLVFIKIQGLQKEDGALKEFFLADTGKKNNISFLTIFENKGNVHLNPYGKIEIRDCLGKKIKTLPIDPYFVLPNSKRERNFELGDSLGFGKYSAFVYLNRGYGDIVDTKYVNFWIVDQRAKVYFGIIILLVVIMIFGKSVNKSIFKKQKKKI